MNVSHSFNKLKEEDNDRFMILKQVNVLKPVINSKQTKKTVQNESVHEKDQCPNY